MNVSKYKVVLWGLKNKRDSFRFIHSGFYEALKTEGIEVAWVPDNPRSQRYLGKNTLVFAVDVDSKHLSFNPETTYVTLNIREDSQTGMKIRESPNWFKIQEYTKQSIGIDDRDGSIALYRPEKKTLYMPWGTPLNKKEFQVDQVDSTNNKSEYWVGAIWNDQLNQGNVQAIAEYREALGLLDIKFKRIGGSRWKLGGLTELENATKVRSSRLGAAIVGNWQKENEYYPCRIFKAVSAGVPPTSNLDASRIFGETLLYSSNIGELVEMAISESADDRFLRARAAQEKIFNYTYYASYIRILRMVENSW